MIDRAANAETGAVADVGVNHRGRDILVPEEFLNGSNIIAILQEMGSKTVPKRVATRRFCDPAGPNGVFDRVLQVSFRDMVPAELAAARIDGEFLGGEDILPRPFASRVGIFPVQGAGKINRAGPMGEVLLMAFLDPGEVCLKGTAKPFREEGNAFPHTFAFSNSGLTISKIDILDAKPETFEQTKTASIAEGQTGASLPAARWMLSWARRALAVTKRTLSLAE